MEQIIEISTSLKVCELVMPVLVPFYVLFVESGSLMSYVRKNDGALC